MNPLTIPPAHLDLIARLFKGGDQIIMGITVNIIIIIIIKCTTVCRYVSFLCRFVFGIIIFLFIHLSLNVP